MCARSSVHEEHRGLPGDRRGAPLAMKPAVFLDRDGTMIRDVGYLDNVDEIEFFPWTVDAIRALDAAGFTVVVTTNQAGIARGLFSEAQLEAIHAAMRHVL